MGAVGVAILARWPLLSDSLWYDEVFTLTIATADLEAAATALAGDVHPPLWYLIEALPARLIGPLAIRWPAMLFGLLALWLAGRVYARLAMPGCRRVAWGLLVLSPMAIYYSTEARMYALLLCLVLLAVYGLLTERPMVWGLAIGAGLLTHYLFVLYLPGMVLLGRRTVRSWSALLTGSGLVALLFAPWLPVVASQSTDVYGAYWLTYAGPGRSLLDVVQLLSGQWLSAGPLLVVSLVVLGCLFLGSGVAIRARYWEILALAWGAPLTGWLISWLAMPILMPRVLIGSLPFLLLLVVWGYQRVEAIAGRWAWSLAVVPLVCWLSVYRPIRPDYATLYAALAIAPGQTCGHLTPGSLLLARHYTPQCQHVLWPDWQRKPNGLSPATVSALELPQSDINEADWLFYTTEPFSTPGELAYLAGLHGAASSMVEGGFYHHQVWRLHD